MPSAPRLGSFGRLACLAREPAVFRAKRPGMPDPALPPVPVVDADAVSGDRAEPLVGEADMVGVVPVGTDDRIPPADTSRGRRWRGSGAIRRRSGHDPFHPCPESPLTATPLRRDRLVWNKTGHLCRRKARHRDVASHLNGTPRSGARRGRATAGAHHPSALRQWAWPRSTGLRVALDQYAMTTATSPKRATRPIPRNAA